LGTGRVGETEKDLSKTGTEDEKDGLSTKIARGERYTLTGNGEESHKKKYQLGPQGTQTSREKKSGKKRMRKRHRTRKKKKKGHTRGGSFF